MQGAYLLNGFLHVPLRGFHQKNAFVCLLDFPLPLPLLLRPLAGLLDACRGLDVARWFGA